MDALEYKGYRGSVRYSAEDRVLHGRILGIDDVVNFEGANVDELERAFHEAVDDYLALCAKLDRDPDRAYSGKIPLRIEGELHRRVAIEADSQGKSVNSWIAETIEAATAATPRPARAATGKVLSMKEALNDVLEGSGAARRGPRRAAAAKRKKRASARKAR